MPRLILRRPLVGLSLSFTAGTGWGLAVDVPVAALFVAAVAAGLGAVFFAVRKRALASVCIHLLFLVLAAAHADMSMRSPSGIQLSTLMARPAEFVRVVGIIDDDPVERPGYWRAERRWQFSIRVESLNRRGRWERARGKVFCRWRVQGEEPLPVYGQKWHFAGLLHDLREDPDAIEYRYRYRMEIDGEDARLLARDQGFWFPSLCLKGRRACSRILERGIRGYPEQAGLLQALLLGYRQDLPDRLYDTFARTGTLHIFAISGLHVGVLAGLFLAIFRSLGLSRQHWVLYLAPLLVVYTVSTGMKASAVRACVMAVIFWSAPLFGRKPDAPSAFALAAMLILLAAPSQLREPGFLFSFIIVAGLIAMVPRLIEPVRSLLKPDPWRVQSETLVSRAGRGLAFGLLSLGAVSTAAWVCSAPLTARYFNLLSPVALLGNMFVIPLAFVVVLTGCLSLATGMFSVLLAEVFNHANRLFIAFLLQGIDFFASLPGGHWFVKAPPIWWVVLWYAALFLVIAAPGLRRRLGLAVMVLLVTTGVWYQLGGDGRVRVDVIDVGDGHAVLVDLPGRRDVLFDTGSRYAARKVLEHLKRSGVNRLQALVLSHADARHAGGVESVLGFLPVDEVWCSPDRGRSRVYDAALEAARTNGVSRVTRARGDAGVFNGGLEWEVLHPPSADTYRKADQASLVLRLSRNAFSALLMGGADNHVEQELLDQPVALAAPVLVCGNQGASNTCSAAWLQAVHPENALISVGPSNVRNNPDRDVLKRFADQNTRVWRTDEDGSIRVTVGKGRLPYRVEAEKVDQRP